MSGEGSYAPKSPDPSSFFSPPAPAGAHQQPPNTSYPQQYPQAVQISYEQHQHQHQHQQHQQQQRFSPNHQIQAPQQPYYQPPPQYTQQPYIQPSQQQQLQPPLSAQPYYAPSNPSQQSLAAPPPQAYGLVQPPAAHQQQQFFQGYNNPPYQQYGPPVQGYQQPGSFAPNPYPTSQSQQSQQPQQPQQLAEQHDQPFRPTSPVPKPESSPAMPPRKAAALAGSSAASLADGGSTAAPSPVKTKFPTARIKRIMQADEEVGKVSQQTPIAVGKALEMFMVALVTKSADVARAKNSKRVTAQMLKQVVESDDQWDFLRDIVKKIDPEEKHTRGPSRNSTSGAEGNSIGSAAKTKLESDSEDEQPKKRGRPGRKKKV
ncbi:cbf nf-y family transcription factor [Grosmannia clavigera kw1407]|uniref:Cbf nf-y family transcription factor n=1 Tax=Grosmannia clavigera (strain kw1407 / UAMH 11150) TaxID=655863 RepID=F0XGX8_GROCL|nr:cbf nf-y family transcription factor [Grosmannia clavigera kw1407]EFX03264.1 cbf nf-y family transcription factor [Grosmannia clavigera kw1407]